VQSCVEVIIAVVSVTHPNRNIYCSHTNPHQLHWKMHAKSLTYYFFSCMLRISLVLYVLYDSLHLIREREREHSQSLVHVRTSMSRHQRAIAARAGTDRLIACQAEKKTTARRQTIVLCPRRCRNRFAVAKDMGNYIYAQVRSGTC
jgi:hypothetical protein